MITGHTDDAKELSVPLSYIMLGVISVSACLLATILVISAVIVVGRIQNRGSHAKSRNQKKSTNYDWKDDSFESDDGMDFFKLEFNIKNKYVHFRWPESRSS